MTEWGSGLACGCLLIVLIWLNAVPVRHSLGSTKRRRHPLYEPMEALMSRQALWSWLSSKLQKPQSALAALNGGVCTRDMLRQWAAAAAGQAYAVLLAATALGCLADSSALAVLGAIIAAIVPLLRWKDLRKKVETHRQAIVLELPELLNRLLLMVNAGENVMRALERCSQRQAAEAGDTPHPLYAELRSALAAVKRGEPLGIALEEFGRRCAVPEAKLFATSLLINARRGGDSFVTALRELSRTLWERRKAAARTLGEQASSRLAFPLAVIFLLIMVLVGAPSILMLSA